jgi:ribosome biogenesis protein MAK21
VFFHKFFSRKHEKEQARAGKADKRKGKRKEDEEEGGDEGDALDDGVGEGSDSDRDEAEIWSVSVCVPAVVSCLMRMDRR